MVIFVRNAPWGGRGGSVQTGFIPDSVGSAPPPQTPPPRDRPLGFQPPQIPHFWGENPRVWGCGNIPGPAGRARLPLAQKFPGFGGDPPSFLRKRASGAGFWDFPGTSVTPGGLRQRGKRPRKWIFPGFFRGFGGDSARVPFPRAGARSRPVPDPVPDAVGPRPAAPGTGMCGPGTGQSPGTALGVARGPPCRNGTGNEHGGFGAGKGIFPENPARCGVPRPFWGLIPVFPLGYGRPVGLGLDAGVGAGTDPSGGGSRSQNPALKADAGMEQSRLRNNGSWGLWGRAFPAG